MILMSIKKDSLFRSFRSQRDSNHALQTDFLYWALDDARETLRFTDANVESVIILVGGGISESVWDD